MVTAVCFTPRLFRCGNDRSARRDASGFSFRRPGRTRCEAPMSKSTQSLLMTAQARQDSNLQPPVLETGALPIELRA